MRKIDPFALLFAGVSIMYPLIAAFAVRTIGPGWVAGGLCLLLAIRAVFGLTGRAPGVLMLVLILVAGAVALVALFDRELSVRLYPAFMNAAMLTAFARSLWRPPSMIERFARIVEPDLPESGVRYTRAVTWVWVWFFVVNGLIAVWTALSANWTTWTLYNGFVAYVAIGVLFAGEWVVRPFVRRAAKGRG